MNLIIYDIYIYICIFHVMIHLPVFFHGTMPGGSLHWRRDDLRGARNRRNRRRRFVGHGDPLVNGKIVMGNHRKSMGK